MLRGLTVLAILGLPAAVLAGPCVTATSECAQWMPLGAGAARSRVYRSFPLTARNEQVRRALVIVHDTERDAQRYFQTGIDAARLAGALQDSIVVAPRFASRDGLTCGDTLAPGELNWPCEGNSWRSGGVARDADVTSFDFADEILRTLARKATFPNLSTVAVVGHSAGGQFVTRYQMANRVHNALGVRIHYVVANPSSYAYPDSARPVVVDGTIRFEAPTTRAACPSYDLWPYGLGGRRGYTEKMTVAELRSQLAGRPATYLLGGRDVLPVEAFDNSCAAMTQGSTRLERGQAFAAYVNDRLRAGHRVTVVPRCGHDAVCMFTAPSALSTLFDDPRERPPG